MNPNSTLLRAALAATITVIINAGCTTNPHSDTSHSEPGEIALDQQVNLTHMHADTHPERRLGMSMAFPTSPKRNPRADEFSNAIDQPEL
ncbi:MAG: hypothetical protein ACXWKG_01185 [Limisphaerales bacterium]